MKWKLLLSSVALMLATRGQVFAQTQVTYTGVNTSSVSTLKGASLDQGHWVGFQELMGIRVDDSGKGPFHNVTTHIATIVFVDKGVWQSRGYETHTDKDGDKVVWEISSVADPQHPGTGNGTGKILAATGKFAGMEGTMTFVLQVMQGFPEGTARTICKENMKITVRNPT